MIVAHGEGWRAIVGNCLDVLADMADNSVDSIITDPPYELGFMGKNWDKSGISFRTETWAALLRVAKPGAILMAFGGTRTWHRLACAIEDAGWKIRDTLMWLYGSGFPKSLSISKAIDKLMGAPRPVICVKPLKDIRKGNLHGASERREKLDYAYTEPATEEARMWAGWGTTLKPAWEPIILAMKPPEGTFAENALIWGVAGLNIDGCRIPAQGVDPYDSLRKSGRWPTNLLLSEDTLAAVQTQCPGAWRFFYCPKTKPAERNICGVNNEHPTIKPLALMRYLVRLTATPSGGVVLDPFMGSGTTGMACLMEGRQFIGIEINEGYFSIAIQRIRAVAAQLPLQEG